MSKRGLGLGLLLAASLLAASPAFGQAGPGNAWFTKVFEDAGNVFEGAKLTYVFRFRNPSEEPRRIRVIQKTCACAMAWLVWEDKEIQFDHVAANPVVVPPGGEGGIKMLLDMTGYRGLQSGTVTMITDDPLLPQTTVTFQATAMQYFEMVPASINLGEFTWQEQKSFSLSVTSRHVEQVKNWNIVRIEAPEGVRLEEPERAEVEGRIVYTLKGTMGPDLAPGPAGGMLRLHTDFKEHVIQVTLAGEVKQPYSVDPRGFFSFGLVRQAKGSPERVIEIQDQDPEHDLKLIGVRLEEQNRPSRFYRIETRNDGGKLQVIVQIRPGAPQGHLKGSLVVELSHPRASRQVIGFSAVVR